MAKQDFEEITRLLKPVELGPLAESPLVSVITPNYNYARYVGEAIESALAQTYANFELIVCDDGSTDNSCDVIEGYARRDNRVKLIRKKNGGVATALNAAYKESKGEIVCLLDADDRYLPEKLERVVQGFRFEPNSGFLGHRMFHIDSIGQRQGVTCAFVNHPSGWFGPFAVCYGDVPAGIAFGSGLCLRRKIADLIFPLPENLRSYLDAVINVMAPLMTPLIGLSLPLAEYRHHGNNLSNTSHVTSESLSRDLEIDRRLWELRREYLMRVNPRLAELFPGCDQRWATLLATYIQARLRTTGGGIRAYRNLVGAECFRRIPGAARWFWRSSVLLPRPLFRRAIRLVLRPNRWKGLVWKALQAMRVRSRTIGDRPTAA